MTFRKALTISFVLVAAASPSIAHAQDAAACKDGYDRSQIARDAGKLVEAQKLLRQCSNASCSAFVQKECVGWLEDVEARLSSVILSAKDSAGADLVDVAVSIDGKDGPRKLDGRALDIDPGDHSFVFQLADGRKAEEHLFLREGEKRKSVSAVLRAPAPKTVPVAAQPAPEPAAPEPAEHTASHGGGQRTLGYALAGVGLVGLGVGAYFGLHSKSTYDAAAAHCPTTSTCDSQGVSGGEDAHSQGTISTISFVVGGVLTAGGVVLFLTAPKKSALSVQPTASASGAGVRIGGVW